MEEIDEHQHKKKEKKDRSPSQKNDNENTQAHTRLTSIPEEELVTLNHSTANSYLVDDIFNFLSLNCFLSRNE